MRYDNPDIYGPVSFAGSVGTAGQVPQSAGAGAQTIWGAVNLASASVTGTLPVTNGGTGTATAFTAGSVIFAGAAGVYSQDNANFFYDSANKALGLGSNAAVPVAQLAIDGTYTGTKRVSIVGTLQSSSAATHAVIANDTFVDLTGVGPVSAVSALTNALKITSTGSNPNITTARAISVRIDTVAGFTGTIANGRAIDLIAPAIAGSQPITIYAHLYGNVITNGNGNTSGTVTNYGCQVSAHTAAAASGGTITNYGAQLFVGSGSGAGTTTNYGLRITGNGGSGGAGTTTNRALYCDSTAISYFAGLVGLGVTAPSTATLQIANGADLIGISIKAFAGQASTLTTWLSSASAVVASVSVAGLGSFAGVTLTDATDLVVGSTTGTKIATATSQKLAFHNSTPVIQRAGAAQAAVATTGSALASFGYTAAAQADGIVTLLNEIRAVLVEKGLMKGAA